MNTRKKLSLAFISNASICIVIGLLSLFFGWRYNAFVEQTLMFSDLRIELKNREIDHLNWMNRLSDLFIQKPDRLKIQFDDHKCKLGQFLYGKKLLEITEKDRKIGQILERIKKPHAELHASAARIDEIWQKRSEDPENEKKALEIMKSSTIPILIEVQAILQQIADASDEKHRILVEKQDFMKTISGVVISMIIIVSLIIAIFLSRFITKGIVGPIMKVVDFAAKLSKGDLSERVHMGRAVDCSEILDCGHRECSSFGIETHCWVKSGSFSNHPECPKAKDGFDCRNCIAYKTAIDNEMEEMGSALNAMADELAIKANLAKVISTGDLTQEVHIASDKDVLGLSLAQMSKTLSEMIHQIADVVSQIEQGAEQLSNASQSLSQSASEQAASVEEISSSMNELNAQTQQNREKATAANQLADDSKSNTQQSNEKMSILLEAVKDIDESSQEILKLIKKIDEISFQTGILSLNAAVEAARAGVYGKGFSVVADEVRNLSDKSADAARVSSDLISNSNKVVERGKLAVTDVAESLKVVVDFIENITALIQTIANSSQEQSDGIKQIDEAVEQVSQVTQQYMASSEETAAMAEELSTQSSLLKSSILAFKLDSDR